MKEGFKLIKNFLSEDQVSELELCLNRIHKSWCKENAKFYKKKAINSAYLTGSKSTSPEDRKHLFEFASSEAIVNEVSQIFEGEKARFLNTQLFFNPVNKAQKNYWHRDIQYSQIPLEEQKDEVENRSNNVVHFRFPLKDEPGIELIPGSSHRWDTDLELDTRTHQNGKSSFNDLPNSETIELKRGDLLIFSANMIHRGIYGKDRLSFDVLYCENDPNILKYSKESSLPTSKELKDLNYKYLFESK